MVRTITKIGNSQGLIFDSALLELTRLKLGDDVNIEVHAGGTITITPLRTRPAADQVKGVIADVMTRHAVTMRKLS